jgi:tetratricopeptide (TPR) repeat protein/transcriptional regulator with XRE-family HTH domain
MSSRSSRRWPLPDGLRPGERDFFIELRRIVDAVGLTYRELERKTSTVRTDAADSSFYSKSQWSRWLNGQAMPPRRAVRRLAEVVTADDPTAERLLHLWEQTAISTRDSQQHLLSSEAEGQAQPWQVPPRQVPSVTPHFTGRATELAALDELAGQVAGGGTEVVVITGTAGVGKTTLANYFCQRVAVRFPDGQLHVNLRGFDPGGQPLDASAALHGFLEALGETGASVPADPAAQAALYRTLVADKSLLIMLDNARSVEQVRPLIPSSPGCLVVVTSRSELVGLIAQGARMLVLTPFTDSDALAFLARRLGTARVQRDPAAAADLVRLCAGLPLAMNVAAAHAAAHPGFPLAALVDELRGRALDHLDTGDPGTSARTVFSWSYNYLSDPGKKMFRLLGATSGPDIGIPAAASLAMVPLSVAPAALHELSRAHLAEEHTPGRFTVHDLLRAYAAELAAAVDRAEDLHEAELRLLDYYLHNGQAAAMLLAPSRELVELPAPRTGVLVGSPASIDAALAWFSAEREDLLALCARAAERAMVPHCWQMPWIIAPYLISQGHWDDFAATQQAGLAAAERAGDLRGLAYAHHHLGYALDLIGDEQGAEPHLRLALDAFTAIGDDLGRGLALHGLGHVLQVQGRYAEALTVTREALRLRSEYGTPATAATSENALGAIYARLGMHSEALKHCQRALRLCEESGIGVYRGEALYNLGLAHLRADDHSEAARSFGRSVNIFREIGDKPNFAAALTLLADAEEAIGSMAAARRDRAAAEGILEGMPPSDAEQVRAWIARETPGGEPSDDTLVHHVTLAEPARIAAPTLYPALAWDYLADRDDLEVFDPEIHRLLLASTLSTTDVPAAPQAIRARRQRWYISAPGGTDLRKLVSGLEERGVELYALSDTAPLGASPMNGSRQAILAADRVLIVLGSAGESLNSAFEAGMAAALGKPLIVIAPPNTTLPDGLAGFLTVRGRPDEFDAVRFALDQAEGHVIEPSPSAPASGRALGDRADGLLDRVSRTITMGSGDDARRAVIDIVAEAIEASGAVAVPTPMADLEFDLGVWSDDLASLGANPMLIALKPAFGPGTLGKALDALGESTARAALIVLLEPTTPDPAALSVARFPVLAITLNDLLSGMRTESFAEVVRRLRNQGIHGRPPG